MSLFSSYDWENDQEWQKYKLNIVFPTGMNEEEAITKIKHKYFKSKVNPEHEIPRKTGEEGASRPQGEPARPFTSYTEDEQPSSSSSSSSSSFPSGGAQGSPSSGPSPSPPPPPSSSSSSSAGGLFGSFFKTMPSLSPSSIPPAFSIASLWLVANFSIQSSFLLFAIFSVLSLLVPSLVSFSLSSYYLCVISAAVNYGISAYNAGANWRNGPHTDFLLVCLMLFSYEPVLLAIFPIVAYSFIHLLHFTINAVEHADPNMKRSLLDSFPHVQAKLGGYAATSELCVIPFLLVKLIMGYQTFLLFITYMIFIIKRLASSYHTRTQVERLGGVIVSKMDPIVASHGNPSLSQTYQMIKAKARNFLDSVYSSGTPTW